MTEDSGEYNGFKVSFQTTGKLSNETHSFLSDRKTKGSNITQRIHDHLSSAAQAIADDIAKERAHAAGE